MSELALQGEQQTTLEKQLSQARERLDGLVRDLRAIDGEMDDIATEREQYRLLGEVCGGLEALGNLGGASLFWGEGTVNGQIQDQLRLARGRVTAFQKGLDEIEERRQSVIDEIERAQQSAEFIEDDLFEAQRQEEMKKLEWIVERPDAEFPARLSVMPWARGGEDDQRFRKALMAALLLSLLLGLVLPMIDLPLPPPWAPEEVPDRLTRLIREERPLPPPPPVEEELMKLPEANPELAEESTPAKQASKDAPKQTAASKGILAFRQKFASLADSQPAARLGAQARIQSSGEAAVGDWTSRSMVATQGQGSSGGINVGALSRGIGGGGGGGNLEGVQIARATTSIGGGGGGDRPLAGGGPGLSRTDEEIQIVFDRHKAALYRLYNRELRRDPTLKGQMVLRIRIETDGSVSLCELQASDMNAPQLSAQVVERVKTFDFGAKEGIPAITILYPIDFLPAA